MTNYFINQYFVIEPDTFPADVLYDDVPLHPLDRGQPRRVRAVSYRTGPDRSKSRPLYRARRGCSAAFPHDRVHHSQSSLQARSHPLQEGGLNWSPTARVQRGESATARCASTEDHQPPSPPLYREHSRPIRLSLTHLVSRAPGVCMIRHRHPDGQTARLILVNTLTSRPARIRWLILALLFLSAS